MDFSRSTRRHLSFFHFLGVSIYQPALNERKSKKFNFHMLVQVTMSLVLSFSCILILCLGNYKPLAMKELELLLIYLTSFCEIAQMLFLLIQYFHHKQLTNDIIRTFLNLESYFAIHMKHRIAYQRFSQYYSYKMILISCAFLQFVLLYAVRWLYFGIFSLIGIYLRILRCITSLTILHIILYVDLLNYHLNELNVVVRRDTFNRRRPNSNQNHKSANSILMRNKIKCYKYVHFRLWTICQKFNTCFGWILMTIILQDSFDFIYSSFWIWMEFHRNSPFLKKCRESTKIDDAISRIASHIWS